MKSALVVCLANICRSPAGANILQKLSEKYFSNNEFQVDSCGIGDWSIGKLPDERMRDAAENRGYILTSRAKQWKIEYLDQFDYILAVDTGILDYLHTQASTPSQRHKLFLITSFSERYHDQNIPDPYYDNKQSFEIVLDMLEDSCEGFLDYVRNNFL